MIPVFIGYDRVETVAWHVLAHSLIRDSSRPLALTPIGNGVLPESLWWRERGVHDSTDFSNARFLVPRLMDFQGWAVFMDCDMVANADIAELYDQRDPRYAVMVRKHEQQILGESKFLGQPQTQYNRKNWSSLMLINCAHPAWTTINPNDDPGLAMHRFEFLEDEDIGEIQGSWNELVEPGESREALGRKLCHFTLGGPWHGWTNSRAAYAWIEAFSDMLRGENPRAHVAVNLAHDGVILGGSYNVSEADAQAEKEASQK